MKFVALEEIASVQLGKMLSPVSKTGRYPFPYLRNQNVQWNRLDLRNMATMDFTPAERIKFEIQPGDLLVCEGGEPGRCAVWSAEVRNCYYQKALHRVRAKPDRLDIHFLRLWLWFQCLFGDLSKENSRTTIAHLPLNKLKSLLIPDIPVSEQREICERLWPRLEAVETAREALRLQVSDIDGVTTKARASIQTDLLEARRVPLSELLIGIETGKSIQTTELRARDDQLGVLKVSAVTWGEFRPREAKATESDYRPKDQHRVRKGDVLISRANTVDLVGAVVRVDDDYPNRLLSDKTLRLILNEERCDPEYIVQALRLSEARAHIEANATGTSDSMRNISQDTIRATPIPILGLPEQRCFAAKLNSVEREITKLTCATQKQIEELGLMPEKLLAQVFHS